MPRKLFSIAVSGQVIPNNVSSVTNIIMPKRNILNLLFATQPHLNLYPIGIRKNPKVIKTTTQKWTNKTVSATNDIIIKTRKHN